MAKEPQIYRPKPLFGFDIGHGSIKVLQTVNKHGRLAIGGYGSIFFDTAATKNGEIVDFKHIAAAANELFKKHLVGRITTTRIAASLPATRTFTRIITIPRHDPKDLPSVVRAESEQYIPLAPENLYLDYQVMKTREEEMDLLIAGAPKNVVDSYLRFFDILGLEVSALEPSILSVARLTREIELAKVPTLIIDMGSASSDLMVYTLDNIGVTGSVNFGGMQLSQRIKDGLGVSDEQAQIIKTKYGIQKSKRQGDILKAVEPDLNHLIDEIKKILHYHEEHHQESENSVGQIVILGGGANLPGLADYLTDKLRLPTHLSNSWGKIHFNHLQPPHHVQTTMFATATGLALINPQELVS